MSKKKKFGEKIDSALNAYAASPAAAEAVRIAVGLNSNFRPAANLRSHMPLCNFAAERLYECLAGVWRDDPPHRGWYVLHLISDHGNSLLNAPVVEAARLRRDFRKVLAHLDLTGIGYLELQVSDVPGGPDGVSVNAHAHVIAYSDDPDFCPMAAARGIARRRLLTNWLGAPTCKIDPIYSLLVLRRWCHYLLKPPVQASRLVENLGKATGLQTRHRDVNRFEALRLVELLARFDLRNSSFTHGALGRVNNDVIRVVSAWCRRRPTREDDYPAVFASLWSRAGIPYAAAAPDVRRDCTAPLDARWSNAMAERCALVAANRKRHQAARAARRASRN